MSYLSTQASDKKLKTILLLIAAILLVSCASRTVTSAGVLQAAKPQATKPADVTPVRKSIDATTAAVRRAGESVRSAIKTANRNSSGSIKTLTSQLQKADRSLAKAETAVIEAKINTAALSHEIESNKEELTSLRRLYQTSLESVRASESKAIKAQEDAKKYKGYHDLVWRILWGGIAVITCLGIIGWVKRGTIAGRILNGLR